MKHQTFKPFKSKLTLLLLCQSTSMQSGVSFGSYNLNQLCSKKSGIWLLFFLFILILDWLFTRQQTIFTIDLEQELRLRRKIAQAGTVHYCCHVAAHVQTLQNCCLQDKKANHFKVNTNKRAMIALQRSSEVAE